MLAAARMSADSALRRVLHVRHVLRTGIEQQGQLRLHATSSSDGSHVTIGDVSTKVKPPTNPELVPHKFLPDPVPQSLLRHLRWILQKDVLGQDVFLIGAPGPLRRHIAMMYLEMTKKEAEYVSLSRDTTETDLKQRREIKDGTAYHIDQCAVRAAIDGRVLILEGIEKAERNVLPVLNNLLENREMQLDDGRFLMAADRYDKLLEEHSIEELNQWKIVRVNKDFRVIALGLPVPRYKGNPLDPPLRSRFQARDIHPLPFKDQLELLNAFGSRVSPDKMSQVLSFALTMKSDESSSLGLPDFPVDNLAALIQILNEVPQISAYNLLKRLYPYEVMLGKEGKTAVEDTFKNFELLPKQAGPAEAVTEVRRSPSGASVELNIGGKAERIQVKTGTLEEIPPGKAFVPTAYHDHLLADMMQSHMVKDFCIIGPRGCGKSIMVKQFADLLGYHIEPIMLYQDMTSRDLLQQRMTLPSGDTAWRPSPLVTAALEGSLALLDGVHRVNPGTFAVLHRLIHDRELTLFDGTRLLRKDKYDEIKEQNDLTDEQMTTRGVLPIHPSFRIVALSEPPVIASSTQQWLNSELLTMFFYHHMRSLTQEEEMQVLQKLVPELSNIHPIMTLTQKLRHSGDSNLKSVATSFSTRQLLRIARRLAANPQEEIYDAIHKACLSRFLPRIAMNALDEEIEHMEIKKPESAASVEGLERAISCAIKDGILRIGNTEVAIYNPENKMKVPDVLFYENPQHLAIMEDMLKDYMLGEHLLLVGNQGVGKNKIVDRFLYLLNRPREYLQLHRDTTVQTLTLQPTVQDGVIIYEDSPLVRAVKNGHILVVDEADKAPTNVTCILKTLVESGEMHLADGRRIVAANSGIQPTGQIIIAHPDFRMMVLANRPGFPFLGNDFFGAMGDIFSAHAVHNPDAESEMSMLRQYGPNVPEDVLKKLVLAFGELRDMADQGQITYPYSTREVVNMVKHLERYPEEGLSSVVKNVFDFDTYNKELTETIVQTLHKHGIPVGAHPGNVSLAKEYPLPKFELVGKIQRQGQGGKSKLMSCPVEEKKIQIKGPVQMNVQSFPLERTEARSLLFSEQEAFWTIPLHETGVIMDVAVSRAATKQPGVYNDDIIHIATANPISLYSMNPRKQHVTCIDLYDIFPHMKAHFRPKVKVGVLGFPLDSNVVLHESITNTVLNVNTVTGEVSRLDTMTAMEAAAEKVTRHFKEQVGNFKMCAQFAHTPEGLVLFYKEGNVSLDVITMLEGYCHSVSFPVPIGHVNMLSRTDWLITEAETNKKFLLSQPEGTRFEYNLRAVNESEQGLFGTLTATGRESLHDALMSAALEQKIQSPNRVYATKENIAAIAVGLPELSDADVYESRRTEDYEQATSDALKERLSYMVNTAKPVARKKEDLPYPTVLLPESGQVVRTVPLWHVPQDIWPEGRKPQNLAGYLEVADIVNHQLRYVPVPGVIDPNPYSSWMYANQQVKLAMAEMSNDGLVTVDQGGCVRLWETALRNLDQSLKKWRDLIGEGEKPLQITYEKELTKQATQPKHGRVDPTGAPHVGGGTWAGGTGGVNTAGMGGAGGPYRLDSGGPVYQVPDVDKENVPEEVRRAAREMAQKAFRERLREIQMSEYDAELYERFSGNVKRQVQSLRVTMDSLQAKGKERQWLKHQTYGDLDEAKLIEGLTGEKGIYKRRGEKEPELGSPQQKPKLVRILVDVSGSMYRFNGHDGRLDREMESMVMVMEALEKYEHKIKYDIVGHSGEGYHFEIVNRNKPPNNNKQRLDAIKTLHAHSQFCISGDHTLEAAEHAIKMVVEEEADEHFVILLSDANLDRYGIRPKKFGQVLTSNEDVNAYVIFIGSLGDQAHRFVKQMPSGRAFLCMDTKNLPSVMQQIFTSTMLDAR